MKRLDVQFQSEGATVRAWFYKAEGGGRRPTVVLAGGWCYVREIVMPTYAKAFAAAGINAMIFQSALTARAVSRLNGAQTSGAMKNAHIEAK